VSNMPRGMVIIDWDKMTGPVIKLKYPETLEISSDLPMQAFMMHTAKEPPEGEISIQVEDANVSSYYFQFKQKNTVRRIILLLLLNVTEAASDFFYILRKLEPQIKDSIDNPKLIELIKDIYETEIISDSGLTFSASQIRDQISERAKTLLDMKKFEEAQSLLKKADEVPFKLAESLKQAENALKTKDHSKAAEYYQRAAELFKEIKEEEFFAKFSNKSQMFRKIPKMQDEVMALEEKAIKALKKNLINETAMHFERAAQVATELTKFDTTRDYYEIKKKEYLAKVKALMLYMKATADANEALKGLVKREVKDPE